jgi:hypothetical protein
VTINNAVSFDRADLPDTVNTVSHDDGMRSVWLARHGASYITYTAAGPDDFVALADVLLMAAAKWREDIRKDHPAADRAMPMHGPAMLGDVA